LLATPHAMKKSHVQETGCSDICHGASGRAKIEDQVDEMPTLLPIVNVRVGDAIPQTILAGPFSLSPPEVLQLIFAAFALYATLPPTNARTDSVFGNSSAGTVKISWAVAGRTK
jgi:hypothetical protein